MKVSRHQRAVLDIWRRLCLAVAVVWPAAAPAGWQVAAALRGFTPQPVAQRVLILVDDQALQADVSALSGERSDIRYQAQAKVLYYVSHAQRRYMAFDEASLTQGSQAIGQFMRMLGEQAAWVLNRPAPVPRRLEIRPTDEIRVLSGLKCRQYTVWNGDEQIQEIWAAPWDATGMNVAAHRVVNQLLSFYDELMNGMGSLPLLRGVVHLPTEAINRINGYPVCIRHYIQGRFTYEIVLGKPEPATIPSAAFNVPAGYEKNLIGLLSGP